MILAIETATPQASVALVDEAGGVRAARRAQVTTHSEELLGLVRDVLAEGGCAVSSLAAVACGAGPGSFTGLRIGLATAKGLCFAIDRPLLMVSTLHALAARVVAPGALVVPCLDAFKGEVYAGFYRAGAVLHAFPAAIVDELAGSPESVAIRIAALRSEFAALHILGNGPTRWPALRLDGAVLDDAPPDAIEVARLALHRLRLGEHDDLASAAPRYLRPSEAEALLARQQLKRDSPT